ncbi:MAG TPA: DUF2332 domain-containing protein [Jatrophihabitantaceae bacterium]|nr:DUF2332 domain-containing protein [Jatrophihabitantaceae bacterium]
MVDWAGHAGQSTEYRYRSMAERQLRGISPSYERLCLGVAEDPAVIALLDTLPAPKRQPNLLLAAVRFLSSGSGEDGIAGPIGSYDAFRYFVLSRWDELSATMLARRTQTNEARRCAVLMPVLGTIPGPVALLEVGASAGLCLQPDRYAYRYDGGAVLGSSALVLECRTSGPVPVPDRLPDVVWRAGLDLNPLDVCSDDDVRWLRSLIWPEQTDRFAVLDAAVTIARTDPAPIVRGDLLTDLASVARNAPVEATLVIYHSAVLGYLAEEQRAQFVETVRSIAASRPTVWVSNEGPGVVVDMQVPDGPVPFVLARDGEALATASPHGDWINWLG